MYYKSKEILIVENWINKHIVKCLEKLRDHSFVIKLNKATYSNAKCKKEGNRRQFS